mmetsp:Transcript_41689/g.126446  ORF Transcript_41689/g.126446 Transcript_41689/m.126446 type:complete len:229 (-) Transcript_41689:4509-5195(-)
MRRGRKKKRRQPQPSGLTRPWRPCPPSSTRGTTANSATRPIPNSSNCSTTCAWASLPPPASRPRLQPPPPGSAPTSCWRELRPPRTAYRASSRSPTRCGAGPRRYGIRCCPPSGTAGWRSRTGAPGRLGSRPTGTGRVRTAQAKNRRGRDAWRTGGGTMAAGCARSPSPPSSGGTSRTGWTTRAAATPRGRSPPKTSRRAKLMAKGRKPREPRGSRGLWTRLPWPPRA